MYIYIYIYHFVGESFCHVSMLKFVCEKYMKEILCLSKNIIKNVKRKLNFEILQLNFS